MIKKSFRLMFIMALMLVLLAACGGDDEKSKTKTFYDGSVSITVPGGWVTEASDIGSRDYGRVTLYSSSKIREAKSSDDLPDNAVVGGILVSKLYDFETDKKPVDSLSSYIDLEGGLPDDAEFLELEINGNPAGRITGTEEQNGLVAYDYNVGIFYEGKIRVYVFLLGFKGEASAFDQTFETLINSITIDVEKMTSQLPE